LAKKGLSVKIGTKGLDSLMTAVPREAENVIRKNGIKLPCPKCNFSFNFIIGENICPSCHTKITHTSIVPPCTCI